MKFLFKFIILVIQLVSCYSLSNEEILINGLSKTDEVLQQILTKWQINSFPNFLRSVAMTHTSWEVLKVKYQHKILSKLLHPENEVKFVITFTGSSVTAGHDTDFNISFSELTGKVMAPAFEPFNIKLESRNAALGNNPCLPYDVCVKTFAGKDADIVHWEQSFNCDGGDGNRKYVFEQYIRQAISLPSRPVVVFSNSVTPNWDDKNCKDKKPVVISMEEKEMLANLKTNAIKIPSELNKHEIQRHWQAFTEIIPQYKSAGLQFWQHEHYDEYKCHPPYVENWSCCSAPWHPSILGHQIRADHYSFFWLLIFRDAALELQSRLKMSSADDIFHEVSKHMASESHHVPSKAIHESMYSDDIRCFTSFQPRSDDTMSLEALVIPSGDGKPGFKFEIFENMFEPGIVINAKKRGYKDFKYMLYGNKDSGALSLKIDVKTQGKSFICQPPGNWGKLPNGFKNFWECDTKMYLTENVADTSKFVFDVSGANTKELKYNQRYPQDSQMNLCVDFEDSLPLGNHVLTVVPTSTENIPFAYLILP
jgi:hypothetical protein